MEVGQVQQFAAALFACGSVVAFGMVLMLPEVQRLIEQQRTQRAREREFARRNRASIEA